MYFPLPFQYYGIFYVNPWHALPNKSLPGCNTIKCELVLKKKGWWGQILMQNILQGVIFLSCPLIVILWNKMDVNAKSEQALDAKGQTYLDM